MPGSTPTSALDEAGLGRAFAELRTALAELPAAEAAARGVKSWHAASPSPRTRVTDLLSRLDDAMRELAPCLVDGAAILLARVVELDPNVRAGPTRVVVEELRASSTTWHVHGHPAYTGDLWTLSPGTRRTLSVDGEQARELRARRGSGTIVGVRLDGTGSAAVAIY